MKLAAVLACRNESSRLYGKPLQNLDVKNQISNLDYIVGQIKLFPQIDDIVLAISEGTENEIYKQKSEEYGIPYVVGSQRDVLGRLISGAECVKADHIYRVTTESPYTYMDMLPEVYKHHCEAGMDYSGLRGLSDGGAFQIISLEALKRCWREGEDKHRSEFATLYIIENKPLFKIIQHDPDFRLKRKDIRLTVDWPEDLIVMRAIYKGLDLDPGVKLDYAQVIQYLDEHPEINQVNNWIDAGIAVGKSWD